MRKFLCYDTEQAVRGEINVDSRGMLKPVDSELSDTSTNPVQNKVIKSALDALSEEMQTWAHGVIQDVDAAGSAAVQSVQSAGDTQVQRVTDEGATQTANAKAQADAAAQSASGAAQSAQEAAESAAVYDDVVTDVNQLKQDIDEIIADNNIITLSNATMMHTAGDATITFDGTHGFAYTRVTAVNNQVGFTFPTQAQKEYTLTLDVSDIASGDGVKIYVCPTDVFNASGALAFEDFVATDKSVTLNFTATTEESSLWFYVRYNAPSCKISNVSVDDGILRYNTYIMDYDGTEISVFNKIACVGDSITEGTFNYTENGSNNNVVNISKYSYPTILKKLTGVETVNLGRGGNTSVQWYSYYQNEDLSGYDAVIIMLGINDGVYSVSVSDFSDAICNIIDKFKAENKGIMVFLSTIIPAYTDYDRKFDNYNTEIKRIVSEEYTDVFLVDINKYSICKHFTYYQQGHLTAVGYQQLAREFATLISYIMHNNLSKFRNVQFIGTNYTYTEE